MTSQPLKILTRPPKPSDLNLVFDSYLRSWRGSKWAGVIPNHLYYETQRVVLEDLLRRGATLVLAYPDPDPEVDTILGWACGEEKSGVCVLHYVYVKDPFLALPVLPALLASLPGTQPGLFTHRQELKQLRAWRHLPEIARRKSL